MDIPDRVAKVEFFLRNSSLPFWASTGFDAIDGGFVERLRADGTPDFDVAKRSLVQARQIYVYSHAAILKLMPDAAATAERGFDFLMRHACPDGASKGFVHALARNGRVSDVTRDLYDHAFLLLGFSWLYKASGSMRVLRAIDELLAAIELMRHPSGQGYVESSVAAMPRRQNPHMHLFEALLAAYHATGRSSMLEKAMEIYRLLVTRFLAGDMLREFFDDHLSPAPFPAGDIAEPGHFHEWAWLLREYGQAADVDTADIADALYRTAMRFGIEVNSGLVVNEIWIDGSLKDGAKRLWPQTEALKSGISVMISTNGSLGEFVEPTVDRIFRYFLDPAPPGTWIDRVGENNKPIDGAIPASSFYHLFLAFANYLAAAKAL